MISEKYLQPASGAGITLTESGAGLKVLILNGTLSQYNFLQGLYTNLRLLAILL